MRCHGDKSMETETEDSDTEGLEDEVAGIRVSVLMDLEAKERDGEE